MIRAAHFLPEALITAAEHYPQDARTHSIRAPASNSGKIRVHGILIPLFPHQAQNNRPNSDPSEFAFNRKINP
jgi:hypothetical protein